MKLLFFQVGDYGTAYQTMLNGVPETYRNQYQTATFVADLRDRFDVTTLSIGSDPHDMRLTDGLRSVRVAPRDTDITAALEDLAPDIIVCRSPSLAVLRYARAKAIPTLPMLADTFLPRTGLRGLRDMFYLAKLKRLLSQDHIPCICNHNINAARTLIDGVGLSASHVVPWDWPPIPAKPKIKAAARRPARAAYAGMISESKGVKDILAAIQHLKEQGLRVDLDLMGEAVGDQSLADWQDSTARMGLSDQVTFHKLISNDAVCEIMHAADIVLVPSQHRYPEGMPKTLIEGLASRSPVVISDHPVFRNRLEHEQDCLQFPAGDPIAFAHAMRRLLEDPALYHSLSANAEHALAKLSAGISWFELITLFLSDTRNESGWVAQHALASAA